MAWLDDPDMQKGVIGTIVTLFTALYTHLIWYFRRRIKKVDDIDSRLQSVEKDRMTREEADKRFDKMFGEYRADVERSRHEISKVHARVDQIYQELIKQK